MKAHLDLNGQPNHRLHESHLCIMKPFERHTGRWDQTGGVGDNGQSVIEEHKRRRITASLGTSEQVSGFAGLSVAQPRPTPSCGHFRPSRAAGCSVQSPQKPLTPVATARACSAEGSRAFTDLSAVGDIKRVTVPGAGISHAPQRLFASCRPTPPPP